MDLQTFKKRLGTTTNLVKSINPDDFSGIRSSIDRAGEQVVDHTQHLESHPQQHNATVQRYREAISQHSTLLNRTPSKLVGVSPKVKYVLPRADKLPGSDHFLVKPYHEGIHPKTTFWQKHLIQGWSEMANQALWHAADMGHIHQRVHVSEHDLGPGWEKHPALVIHMHPDTNFVNAMRPGEYDDSMHEDLAKIVAMDFLTNNLDRHRQNLLYRPKDAVDDDGSPALSRLIAIDHGRSFQYQASHKGVPTYEDHPLFGRMAVPAEVKDEHNHRGKTEDSIANYMQQDGPQIVDARGMPYGNPPVASPEGFIPHVVEWWPEVRHRVTDAFDQQLRSIRDEKLRTHLERNFAERVKKLDEIVSRPEYYMNEALMSDLKVPLHRME